MPVNLPTHKISENLLRIVEAVETLENSVLMKKILSANIADKYLSTLKSKPTKKKPLSNERMNFMIMPVFKYLESKRDSKG